MWSRGKGASRKFLPGFPLGQSMTYRLPIPANQAPGTPYTTTSQPSDGPLAVGLLAPGQSQQGKKKKKNHRRRGIAHYKNRPCFVWRSFLLQLCLYYYYLDLHCCLDCTTALLFKPLYQSTTSTTKQHNAFCRHLAIPSLPWSSSQGPSSSAAQVNSAMGP